MKTLRSFLKIIILSTIAVLIFSTAVIAVNSLNEVKVVKMTKEPGKELPKERIIELYDKGYGLDDIEKGAEIAAVTGDAIDEILELKGRTAYRVEKTYDGYGNEIDVVLEELVSWKEAGEKSGMEIPVIIDKTKLTSQEFENAKREYFHEISNRKDHEITRSPEIKSDIENELVKWLKITDEELEKCRKYGVDTPLDAAFAKGLAVKYNIPLDEVLEIKSEKAQWKEVDMKLEVLRNEE